MLPVLGRRKPGQKYAVQIPGDFRKEKESTAETCSVRLALAGVPVGRLPSGTNICLSSRLCYMLMTC